MNRIRFVGSGDAFGSGGRFQACIALEAGSVKLLLDCGTTSLVAMRQQGFDPTTVNAIAVSHLHGDHFGGIPFLILAGQFSRRERALEVIGPVGTAERLAAAMETLYPGSSTIERRFETRVIELNEGKSHTAAGLELTPFAVRHASGAAAFAYRVEAAEHVVAYTGDTEWCEGIVEAARGADLLISEAYTYERAVKFHLPFAEIKRNRDRLTCKAVVVTHMGPEMLAHLGDLPEGYVAAWDGLEIPLDSLRDRGT